VVDAATFHPSPLSPPCLLEERDHDRHRELRPVLAAEEHALAARLGRDRALRRVGDFRHLVLDVGGGGRGAPRPF